MNKRQLEREGKKWVEAEIISQTQLQTILNRYEKEDRSYLLVILAALLISISIIVFIFSDWAQIPNLSRISVMLLMMLIFYATGFYYKQRDGNDQINQMERGSGKELKYTRSEVIGISLIVLGYITFGSTLLLTLSMYNVQFTSAWPFIVWSIVGLLLYMIVPNNYLFVIALVITIYGQFHSSLNYATFNYIVFGIFIIGYFHYVFHRGNNIIHYVFSFGLALQLLLLSMNEFNNFYWFLFFMLVMYSLSIILPKRQLKNQMIQTTILSLFIYKIYETISVQEDYIMDTIVYQPSFFIIHMILLVGVAGILLLTNRKELITLLLFVPLFFLPHAHLYIIVSLFLYSIYWLIYGFQKDASNKIMLGMFSFLISIFTVIVQFAWETINKSLFFLVAGLILFAISILLERKRRRDKGAEKR